MNNKGTGWITFSSIVLIVAGLMRIMDGIWALGFKNNEQWEIVNHTLIISEEGSLWAWAWFGIGAILVLAGIAVSQGSSIGRWVGIVAASFAAVTAMIWMPMYPIWALAYLIMGLLVIYGLVVYGGEALQDA